MNKKVRNIIIFVMVALFITAGVMSKDLYVKLFSSVKSLFSNEGITADKVDNFIDNVEGIMSDELTYHDQMMDVNSFVISTTGQDYVVKDGQTIVKTKSGYLAFSTPKMKSEIIERYAQNTKELYDYAQSKDIPFLFVMAPQKGYGMEFPAGTENYIAENCSEFLNHLDRLKVPYLEIRELMEKEGMTEEKSFFATDHHWTPDTAFWATGKICEALNIKYGFNYDRDLLNLKNYNIKTYKDWFLGSQGKKVGTAFTFKRVDDINLITPKFETKLRVEQPLKNQVKEGTFEETVIVKSNIETKNYYKLNPYAVYTGGDYHIETIENLNNPNGEDILVIRDSFACAVTPFLSLTARNTHILDLRNYDGMYGPRVESVRKYIDEMNPDYIVILYNGISEDDLKYDFD